MASRQPEAFTIAPANFAGAARAPAQENVAPQLATLTNNAPTGDNWLHEIKLDGYRMLAHVCDAVATLYSRNGWSWTRKLPERAKLRGLSPFYVGF